MAETRSLHRKLAQVMYEAERIPKNGTAPAVMGGYKFVQVGDAADFIRKALAEKVVTMIPTAVRVVNHVDRPTAKGGLMTTVDMIVTWTLTDGETGETATIESFGAGADGGDKYSGKASTSAMKYALLSGFLLSTGEDSELGTDTPLRPPRDSSELVGAASKTPEKPEPLRTPVGPQEPVLEGTYSEAGTIVVKKTGPSDGLLRQTPDGGFFRVAFEAESGVVPQVDFLGSLAIDVYDAAGDRLHGLACTLSGDLYRVPWQKDGKAMRPFQRLVVKRIVTSDWALPIPEAPSVAMFPDDEAELDGLL